MVFEGQEQIYEVSQRWKAQNFTRNRFIPLRNRFANVQQPKNRKINKFDHPSLYADERRRALRTKILSRYFLSLKSWPAAGGNFWWIGTCKPFGNARFWCIKSGINTKNAKKFPPPAVERHKRLISLVISNAEICSEYLSACHQNDEPEHKDL